MTDEERMPGHLEVLGPEQGGGPPDKLPWTLEVEGEWAADLEHGSALPRVGELVEYITASGNRIGYRVREIVHTVQASASERPMVRDERAGPNSTVAEGPTEPPRALRAGLPRVVVGPPDEVG